MKAKKENKEYSVTKANMKEYLNAGFDIYDDDGTFLHAGHGKKITYEKYEEDLAAKDAEIAKLKKEIAKLKKDEKTNATKE